MKLTLIKKIQQAIDVVSFHFKTDQQFSWTPGQYLHYYIPHPNPDNRGQKRYFSISTAPYEGVIGLTSRFTNEGGSTFKKALLNLQIGNTIKAENLEGEFIVNDVNKEYIFIAGGIGITPFRAILLDLANKNLKFTITFLYVNRNNDFIFKNELEKLTQDQPNFKIHYFVEPDRIDEIVIKEKVGNLDKPIFYISGPTQMVFTFEEMLEEMGIPKTNIKLDDFPGYTDPKLRC